MMLLLSDNVRVCSRVAARIPQSRCYPSHGCLTHATATPPGGKIRMLNSADRQMERKIAASDMACRVDGR